MPDADSAATLAWAEDLMMIRDGGVECRKSTCCVESDAEEQSCMASW